MVIDTHKHDPARDEITSKARSTISEHYEDLESVNSHILIAIDDMAKQAGINERLRVISAQTDHDKLLILTVQMQSHTDNQKRIESKLDEGLVRLENKIRDTNGSLEKMLKEHCDTTRWSVETLMAGAAIIISAVTIVVMVVTRVGL
jgi:predicted  nucleic acid-binding Zn-ribbon protein